MSEHPIATPCAWCERMTKVYDVKASGHVWYECEEGHLSLWSPHTKAALLDDDPRLKVAP